MSPFSFTSNGTQRWSITEVNKQGEPLLHDLLADWFTQKKEYGLAQRHFIRGSSPEKFAVMLVSFAKEGHPSEVDLFIARAVLQYAFFPLSSDHP